MVLIRFTPDAGRTDFLENCKLAAHTALRVLTRSARAGERPSATRCYLGLPNPVWNNTGDRATLYDEFFDYARKGDWPKSRLTSFGYGTQQYSEPNDTGPIVLAPAPPAPQTTHFSFLNVIFGISPMSPIPIPLEDGDTVTITTNESAIISAWIDNGAVLPGTIRLDTGPFGAGILPSGQAVLNLPRRLGPAILAPASDGGGDFPVPGAPQGGLICGFGAHSSSVDQCFFVGAGITFTATLNRREYLFLGINDSNLSNNDGFFLVTVQVGR